MNIRRARLCIPSAKLREIFFGCALHRSNELFSCDCAAVMALKIDFHTFLKRLFTYDGVNHSNQLRALFVNRRSVEVIDFDVRIRPNGMCYRAGIFRELNSAKVFDFLNTLHSSRIRVRSVFLISKNGQTFFQRELEPISTGHTVPSPIVKVLVRHHTV